MPNRLSAGASPQTPLGAYSAPPDSLVGLGGGSPGKGNDGREWAKEGGEGMES